MLGFLQLAGCTCGPTEFEICPFLAENWRFYEKNLASVPLRIVPPLRWTQGGRERSAPGPRRFFKRIRCRHRPLGGGGFGDG